MKKIKNIAIAGATGFSGIELIKILLKHPYVRIKYLFAQSNTGKPMSFFDKDFKNIKLPLVSKFNSEAIQEVDTIFTALPHGESHFISNVMNSKTTLIDLSADFRLDDKNIFQTWYKTEHKSVKNQKKAVYGLSEINRKNISKTNIIACPGCYPTSILLPLIPLIKRNMINANTIKADSKSGYSGAGKKIYDKKLYPNNIYENIGIYGVALNEPSPLENDFYPLLQPLLRRSWSRPKPLRLVGVRLSNLHRALPDPELALTGLPQRSMTERLNLAAATDKLRRMFGPHAILRGHDLLIKRLSKS